MCNKRNKGSPDKTTGWVEYVIINYRWVFVCLFLLPLSFVYDVWLYLRNWVVFRLSSAPKQHDKKVLYVQRQVKEWDKNGRKQPMCTARPGWQMVSFRAPAYKNIFHKVKVNLVDILEVDTEREVVRVEPLVSMGQLSATLNPLGWTIPVLPEMDDLTVGGLVMGTGIESSSHIYGLFQHICLSYELVLCDGSVVKCSPEENSELYYSVPWSYGTLGFLTAVEIRMIPAKRFVKLSYEPIKSIDEFSKRFQEVSRSPSYEFVEALAFSKDEYVLMTGNQVTSGEVNKINSIGSWYKPWFFVHVQSMLQKTTNTVEYIPLRDYYHRHTRSIFWELRDIVPFGNNPLFRLALGWLMPPKVSLLKLTTVGPIKELYETNHMIQDMLVPIEKIKPSIELFDDAVQIYPMWICPFKLPQNPGMVHPPVTKDNSLKMYVDIGVYGVPKAKNFDPKATTRRVEKYVIDVHGFQMLYADTYMTKEEFRRMFDHTLYDKLRRQLNCEAAFPEVYDKISREARI